MNTKKELKDVKTVVVSNQVIIYKNIFKNNKDVLNMVEKDTKEMVLLDDPLIAISPWEEWYSQGYRRGCWAESTIKNNNYVSKELKTLVEFYECLSFIRQDYFERFNQTNSIWPNFIKNWELLKNEPQGYFIDFFKYDLKKINSGQDKEKVMMKYHVDELPILNEFKKIRNVVTINIYLNDQYSGGEICVYDSSLNKSYMYKPKTGDAVVMPSFSPFYHAVNKFNDFDRYFMRAFFKYECDGEYLEYDEVEKNEDQYVKDNLQILSSSAPEEILVDGD